MARPKEERNTCSGQASVEYALVLSAFLALIIAFGAMQGFLRDGALVTHALECSSHAIANVCSGASKDVFSV